MLCTLRHNEKVLAEMRLQQQSPEYRNRTGRIDKWREFSRAARDQLQVELPVKERLSSLGLEIGPLQFLIAAVRSNSRHPAFEDL